MAPTLTTTRIQLKRDTAANWTSNNPILAQGEPGLETDTGFLKIGDGSTHWVSLSYQKANAGGLPASVESGSHNAMVVGDATTDDAPAINVALAAAAGAGGGKVYVPWTGTGVCAINTLIVIPSGVTLVVGHHVTLKRKSGFSGPMIVNNAIHVGSGRDANVGIEGEGPHSIIDGGLNAAGSGSVTSIHIRIAHCDRPVVRNLRGKTVTQGKYWLRLADVTDFVVENIDLDTFSDGVHITGPAARGRIENVGGVTSDDTVALCATEGTYNYAEPVAPTYGDITDVAISNIWGDNSVELLALYGCTGQGKIRRVTVDGLYGANQGYAVRMIGDTSLGQLEIGDVTVRDVRTTIPMVAFLGGAAGQGIAADNIAIEGVGWSPAPGADGWHGVAVGSGSTIERLRISNLDQSPAITAHSGQFLDVEGIVTLLDIDHVRMNVTSGVTTYLVSVAASGEIDNLILNKVWAQGLTSLFANFGSTPSTVWLTDSVVASTNTGRLIDARTATVVHLRDVDANTNHSLVYVNGGTVRVLGGGINNIGGVAGIVRQATEACSVNSPTFPVDTAILTPATGDAATNTNSSATYGTGPVIYNGTAWSNTASEPIRYVGAGGQPAFALDFANYGSGWRALGFYRDSAGKINIEGAVDTPGGQSAGASIFTLPVGYRPSATVTITGLCPNSGTAVALDIKSDGTVTLRANWSAGQIGFFAAGFYPA